MNDRAVHSRACGRLGIYEELMPLHQACAAAYHVLFDGPHPARGFELEEACGLIAISLSRVATLYRMTEGAIAPLSEGEIRDALFIRAASSWEARLRNLFIRRGALIAAVESLKSACLLHS